MGHVRLAALPDLGTLLRTSYQRDLGPIGAFLPAMVPVDELPPLFAPYVAACDELPTRYPREHGGVRRWMDHEFRRDRPEVGRAIARLDPAEADALMTALCALAHTYRWDSLPPVAARFDERRISLPPGIAVPWGTVARKTGQPRVGSAWNLHLTNWTMTDRPGGSPYRPEELSRSLLRVARTWLAPPVDADLESFSVAFVLMEASGAAMLLPLVEAIESVVARRREATLDALHRLERALATMTLGFSLNVRRRTIDPAVWLELIQPTYAWGADSDQPGCIQSGPSGMQLGTIQALDAVLGVGGRSALAQLAGTARRHMPRGHRRFLRTLDAAGPVLRDFVLDSRCDELTAQFDACVIALGRFRITHRARGALYLRSRPSGDVARASTGLTIGVHDEALATFERSMDERVIETQSALLRPGLRRGIAERHVAPT